MNAKRLTLALLVSLLISGLFTFWLTRRVASAGHGVAPTKLMVVGPKETLEAGQMLKPESLRLIEWPVSLSGSVLKMDDIAGRILLFPVAKDQPILSSYLAPPGVSSGLTAKIPSG